MAVWAAATTTEPHTATCPVDPLWRLLQAAPDTARAANQNDGRLPLHAALTAPFALATTNVSNSGRPWNPPPCLAEDAGLSALVQADPAALAIADPVTGLTAVGLVASVASQVPVASDKDLLGFIYSILRQCPCVLPRSRSLA